MFNVDKILWDVELVFKKMDFEDIGDFGDYLLDIYEDEDMDKKSRKKEIANEIYRWVTLFGVKKICYLCVSFLIDIAEDKCKIRLDGKNYRIYIEDKRFKMEEILGD